MARPNKPGKPYSLLEKEYIRRVAGQVPADVIATQINRTKASVLQWASAHDITLRVSHAILLKHWPDHVQKEKSDDISRRKNG